jgi:hypothetical protein
MGWVKSSADKVRIPWSQKDDIADAIGKARVPASELSGMDVALSGNTYSHLTSYLQIEQQLVQRYIDYEFMDDYPELGVGLDIYADEITQPDWMRNVCMWVKSDDDWVKNEMMGLYHQTLNVEDDIWSQARTLCKYGSNYAEILLSEQGVVGTTYMPPNSTRILVNRVGEEIGYMQDPLMRFMPNMGEVQYLAEKGKLQNRRKPKPATMGADGVMPYDSVQLFEPWEVVNWRLRTKHPHSLYGQSILENSRWVWRRLALIEDAMMIYRLEKSPSRFAFIVDTGSLPQDQALAYVKKVRAMYKRKKFYNQAMGGLDLKNSPLTSSDDFFIPAKEGRASTTVQQLGGLQWQAIDDIMYMRNKLGAAIKIPNAYMGYDGQANTSHLSHTDVKFARAILRIQRELKRGYQQYGIIHLLTINKPKAIPMWSLEMTTPTMIFELAQLEALDAKAKIMIELKENVSLQWVLTNVFHFTEQEALQVMQLRFQENAQELMAQAQAEVAVHQFQLQALGPETMGLKESESPNDRRQALAEKAREIYQKPRSPAVTRRLMEDGDRKSERRMSEILKRIEDSDDAQSKGLAELRAGMAEIRAQLRS